MAADADVQLIARKSLHRELVDRLQLLITRNRLKPGSKIPEKDLCEQFGVSRTPLREALKVLATDGLVRLEQNRGAWVSNITVEEVEEVFPVLGALEALSGELACKNITENEVKAIRKLHDQLVRNYQDRNLDAYFKTNQKIHKAILLAARNKTLLNYWQTLTIRMQRARYLANMSDERWAEAVNEHELIMQFLERRNGPELAATLTEHMRNKQQSVLRWLRVQNEMT
ncbi:MAG: GntR family transcriptional regulator [Pseudomonadota bacterium]